MITVPIAKNTRGGRPKLYEDRAEIRCGLSLAEREELRSLVVELDSSTSRTLSALVAFALQHAHPDELPSGRSPIGASKQIVSGYIPGTVNDALEDLVADRHSTRTLIIGALAAYGLRHANRAELPRGRNARLPGDQEELPLAAS